MDSNRRNGSAVKLTGLHLTEREHACNSKHMDTHMALQDSVLNIHRPSLMDPSDFPSRRTPPSPS